MVGQQRLLLIKVRGGLHPTEEIMTMSTDYHRVILGFVLFITGLGILVWGLNHMGLFGKK